MEGCPPDLLPKNLLRRAQTTESLSGHSCGSTTAPMLSHVYSRLPQTVAEHGGTRAESSCTVQASPNRQPLFENCQSALLRPPQDSLQPKLPPNASFPLSFHAKPPSQSEGSLGLFLFPFPFSL